MQYSILKIYHAIQLLLDVWEFTSNLGYDRKCYYDHSYAVHTFWWTYMHIFLGPWLGVELLSHKFLKCSVLSRHCPVVSKVVLPLNRDSECKKKKLTFDKSLIFLKRANIFVMSKLHFVHFWKSRNHYSKKERAQKRLEFFNQKRPRGRLGHFEIWNIPPGWVGPWWCCEGEAGQDLRWVPYFYDPCSFHCYSILQTSLASFSGQVSTIGNVGISRKERTEHCGIGA